MPDRRMRNNRRREAQLRREAAEAHPTIPARMWTPVKRLERLVTEAGDVSPQGGRLLNDSDFVFRGGVGPRKAAPPQGTRRGEPGYVERDLGRA